MTGGLNRVLERAPRRFPVLGRAIDSVRSPGTVLALRRDIATTTRELVWLRAAPVPNRAQERRVLVLAMAEAAYGQKLLFMLATALRLRGWRPIVVAESRRHWSTRGYARAFGIDDVRYFEDVELDEDELEQCGREATTMLAGPLSFPAVKEWTYRGAWIGPQLLSTVSRRTMRGAPDPADPAVRNELAALLPDTMARVRRAEKLVEQARPDLATVIEANYAANGAVVDVAVTGGVGVIQVTQPWRDDALMCRRLVPATRREHPSSVGLATLDRLSERPWTTDDDLRLGAEFERRYGGAWVLQSRNQPATRRFDRAGLVEHLGLDPTRKIVVVFSHVLWDANLFYGTDLFEDYGDWFTRTALAAAANAEVSWLVKLHPANLWKQAYAGVESSSAEEALVREHVGVLPDHVTLLAPDSDVSTLSLFEHADVGVTVRGTAGMEMACFGKPVLTAGTGRYSGLGFTIDSTSAAEYLDRLACVQHLQPLDQHRTQRAKRHADTVFRLRHWPMSSFSPKFSLTGGRAEALDHDLRPVARSVEDVHARGDLDRWAAWAEGDEIDYLDADTDA